MMELYCGDDGSCQYNCSVWRIVAYDGTDLCGGW